MDLFNSQKKEKLKESVRKILEKYDDRVPIFVFRSRRDSGLNNIDKNKYIVPTNLTAGELLNIIRKKLEINRRDRSTFYVGSGAMGVSPRACHRCAAAARTCAETLARTSPTGSGRACSELHRYCSASSASRDHRWVNRS